MVGRSIISEEERDIPDKDIVPRINEEEAIIPTLYLVIKKR